MLTRLRFGFATGIVLATGWLCSSGAAAQLAAGERRASDLEAAKRLIGAGSIDRAIELLKRLVVADPKDADAHLLLGTTLALTPRRSEALQILRRAVDLRPDSAQTYLALGNALARFSEMKAAREAYEKSIALDPRSVMAHGNLALILAASGELAAAADHLSKAMDLLGDSAEAARYHYLRGRVYRQQNRPKEAGEDFEKAIRLRPGYAEAYRELGVVQVELQMEAAAVRALETAVALAPDDAEARYQLALCYLRTGEAQRAAGHLQQAARLRPDDRNLLYALVRALRAAGKTDEAEPLMQRLSRNAANQALREPDILRAGALNNEGIALEKEGKFAAALEKYRAALVITPQETGFRRNLALVLCRLERWKEAVAELKEVLRITPGDADATRALYIALEKVDHGQ